MPNYFRDYFASVSVAAGASATIWSKRWIGEQGMGYGLGVGVQDPNLWATVEFNVEINGVPVLDYGKIQDRIGSPDQMTPVRIPIPPYAMIEFKVTNGGASETLFFGRLLCKTME